MESFGGSSFDGVGGTVKKKRSNTSRRPRPDSQPLLDTCDPSQVSSTPPSDNVSKVSSDENTGYDASSRKKEFNLNQCTRMPFGSRADGGMARKKIRKDEGTFVEYDRVHANSSKGSNDNGRSGSDSKRCSEGVLAPANWKSTNKMKESSELQSRKTESHNSGGVGSDGIGNETKFKKVKLKVGGVTRTIHAKSTSDVASGGGSTSNKSSRSSDAPRPRQKLILSDNSEDDESPPPPVNASGLQGVSWTNFSRGGFGGRGDSSKGKMHDDSGKQTDKSETVRKSKRVPKRRVLDDAFEDSDDEEIRYLERLKTSKSAPGYGAEYGDDDDEGSKKERRSLKVSKSRIADGENDEDMEEYGSSRSGKDGKKKPRSNRVSEDTDYFEEDDELASDGEPEAKRKKPRKESVEMLMENKKEISLTTRQRALQSGKDVSSGTGASLIEFPNGLPPAPPRKQKDKLSEVEQQLKKAEAAQRRRMQVEKAARESEAEAIRKILGQDSTRKRREDKNKRRREELAQERAANAMSLAPNTVKWVIGPTGTVVTFPADVGLPSIFDTKQSSYPPPREKCAGPSCSNTYKYRDSKSKLPLCSLQCYKAIHENMQPLASC